MSEEADLDAILSDDEEEPITAQKVSPSMSKIRCQHTAIQSDCISSNI